MIELNSKDLLEIKGGISLINLFFNKHFLRYIRISYLVNKLFI